jgi:hypothetical protein
VCDATLDQPARIHALRLAVLAAAAFVCLATADSAASQRSFCTIKPKMPTMRNGVLYGGAGVSCTIKANIQVFSCLVHTLEPLEMTNIPKFRGCNGERVWGDWVAYVESRWACNPATTMKSFWHVAWYLYATAPGKLPISRPGLTATNVFRCDP